MALLPALVEDALVALAARTGDARLCGHIEALHHAIRDAWPDEPPGEDLEAALARCRARAEPDLRHFR